MTREIKFRAWYTGSDADISGKLWDVICVDLWKPPGNTPYVGLGGHYHVPVSSVVLSQFTGLHDRHGKEIYEGDICRVTKVTVTEWSDPDPHTRIIKWNETKGGFDQFRLDGKEGGTGWCFLQSAITEYYEVIGNIWENPELLEHGDD